MQATKKLNVQRSKKNMEYDIFVSHCHQDKLKYVDDLVDELKKLDIKVFYDTDEITWGDEIREKIENGLKNSKLAIVVISRQYFGRYWTEYEIKKLFERQFFERRKIVLPILYQISKKDIEKHYPFLANISFKYARKQSKQKLAEEAKKELEKLRKITNETAQM